MDSKEVEALYRSFFDNTLDGIAYCEMIFDTQNRPIDFCYLLVNKNFEELTGLKGVEGKRVTELIPGIVASNPHLFEIYGRVSMGGNSEKFEIYLEPLARWFLISAYCPKKNFFVAVFQNITERKQTEKNLNNAKIAAVNVLEDLQTEKDELAYAKAKDEAMLESIGDGLIGVDDNRRVTIINKAAMTMLGWKSDELIGRVISDMPLEDEAGNLIPPSKRPTAIALATGKTKKANYFFVRKDKTRFPLAISASPILIDRKIKGAIVVFYDITKEQEVDRAKTEFVSLASHQLRSPITTIKWYAEMLLSGDVGTLSEQQKSLFAEIYHGSNRMADLVDALLNVSRLELGTFVVELEPTNIAELALGVIKEQKVAIDTKKISFKTTIAKNLPIVQADTRLLRMVISNILSNAVKYTPQKGSVHCAIWTVKKGEMVDGREVDVDSFAIGIVDTGYGIPQKQQDKIFSKLFRADNIRNLDTDGTGLGLYIVKAIVDHSGGQVWFESEENRGSSFYVTLPLAGMQKNEGTKQLS